MVTRIRVDMSEVERAMRTLSEDMKKHVPYAAAVALTRTAGHARDAATPQLKADLNKPRPFTSGKGAFFILPAKKDNLAATLGFKDLQARYMQYQIEGGKRRQKGYEVLLRSMGALPAGWVTVPGAAAPVDGYGNIKAKALSEMISILRRGMGIYRARGRGRRRSAQIEAFFAVVPGTQDARSSRLPPGIYMRRGRGRGSAITPWLMFAKEATYQEKRFDFEKLGKNVTQRKFNEEFRRAFDAAVRSSR